MVVRLFAHRLLSLAVVLSSLAAVSAANADTPSLCALSVTEDPIARVGYSHPLFPIVEKVVRMRYDITVEGVEDVASRGRRGILFAMNHPSFSDPAIVTVALKQFQLAPVMSLAVAQMPIVGPIIKYGTDKVGTLYVPKADSGLSREERRQRQQDMMIEIAERLNNGENIVLWPAGELMEAPQSRLGNARMLAEIIGLVPDVRVVLGRTSGLWGSAFGGKAARDLDMNRAALKAAEATASNIISGGRTPKRPVTLELFEPEDLPRQGSRSEINQYVEDWYNEIEQPLVNVPYNPFGG